MRRTMCPESVCVDAMLVCTCVLCEWTLKANVPPPLTSAHQPPAAAVVRVCSAYVVCALPNNCPADVRRVVEGGAKCFCARCLRVWWEMTIE